MPRATTSSPLYGDVTPQLLAAIGSRQRPRHEPGRLLDRYQELTRGGSLATTPTTVDIYRPMARRSRPGPPDDAPGRGSISVADDLSPRTRPVRDA